MWLVDKLLRLRPHKRIFFVSVASAFIIGLSLSVQLLVVFGLLLLELRSKLDQEVGRCECLV